MSVDKEQQRLQEDRDRLGNWKRWGPYLSERQWGTVREDYSSDCNVWSYLTHDQARSRAYRWGEDGLLGITDRQCRLAFALGLWNERDNILKERLYGLTGPEGNHGEDVKESYFYLDSTPTHSYMKALYKYPQAEYPYKYLLHENSKRTRLDPEFELVDTGVFKENRYFDIVAEYAKASPNDILIQITATNHGPEASPIHILPHLWFRNTWSWKRKGEGFTEQPRLYLNEENQIVTEHESLEAFTLTAENLSSSSGPIPLFTQNETNRYRLFGEQNSSPYVKDAFHEYVVHNRTTAVDPGQSGTKAAFYYKFTLQSGESKSIRLRLSSSAAPFEWTEFDQIFNARKQEADTFFETIYPKGISLEQRKVLRQADAGLLWTKQFYYYAVGEWLDGDPEQSYMPDPRRQRNHEWRHLYNRDVISMPDKWEYPWYAAWDLAFHMVAFARFDEHFAKQQLLLFLREWYMHPNGQIPAYEFGFSDVNPPVHAWACWRVYQMGADKGRADGDFLKRSFLKLMLNFNWWVNRKDIHGRNLFSGGFLGLDNIGVFDRGAPLPKGGFLEQADATAWMAFYCVTMLSMALELAKDDSAYDDLATKFFEHFVGITDAINHFGGMGLWDQLDGFYYDQLQTEEHNTLLRVRSLVGLIPLLAVETLNQSVIDRLPGFKRRLEWFLTHRQDLARHVARKDDTGLYLLAVPSEERLRRMLRYVLDETEFLSAYGVRSLSKIHTDYPYSINIDGTSYQVDYCPGDSNTSQFGGNSNWRGPIWFPINFLMIEALEKFSSFYESSFTIECPTGSGKYLDLEHVALELAARLEKLFIPDHTGKRPCHGDDLRFIQDPAWKDLILFYEHFHGDTGAGIGASHQTGWTALVTLCIDRLVRK